jgi:hypothetical protein
MDEWVMRVESDGGAEVAEEGLITPRARSRVARTNEGSTPVSGHLSEG